MPGLDQGIHQKAKGRANARPSHFKKPTALFRSNRDGNQAVLLMSQMLTEIE